MAGVLPGQRGAAADPSPSFRATSAPSAAKAYPEPSLGNVSPIRVGAPSRRVYRSGQANQDGDTVWVFRDSLETRSSPSNEDGWTHVDASFQPAAWHIDTVYGCEGHSFWCGRIDSSWVNDANRRGYDNNWTQVLKNFVNLSGAASPVKISFKQQLESEDSFDFGTLEVLDIDASWVPLRTWSGSVHGQGAAPCDTFTIQIPDTIIAKYNPVQFRFIFTSDIGGSAADGISSPADGWSVDNVTVKAGTSDLRFFDDFESGPGTWTVSTFPAVGDNWRIQANVPAEQVCTANTSKVWTVTSPVSGALIPRIDDKLISPPILTNKGDQVFVAFDVYRNLPLLACFYYNIQYRTRNVGAAWSLWSQSSSQIYFGTEKEWIRQTVALPGAAGKDSVEFMLNVKDYSQVYCDGVSTPSGTAVYFDNLALGVIGLAPPSIVASEQDLFQDTFNTAPFWVNDNINTPSGDSTSVRISASRGLKQGTFFYSLNGSSFASLPLTPFGASIPSAYSADVPVGSYARGTRVRYYFSVTDSLNTTVTLPSDALAASHYFDATVLPAIQSPSGTCAGDTAKVLYVNAFSGPEGGASMDQSLTALGLRFDRYDVNSPASSLGNSPGGGTPGPTRYWPATSAATLGMYSAIIWDVGERSSSALTAEEQQLLQAWIKRPGANRGLLAAGDNLAYDLVYNGQEVNSFFTCTLGGVFLRDIWENTPQDSLTPTLTGATGTRIAKEPFPLDGTCPSINRFDALGTSSCAGSKARGWIAYPNTMLASIEKRDSVGVVADSSRSVLLGFSLGAIPSIVRRNLLLYRTIVEEFEVPGCYVATGVEETPAPAGSPAARLFGAAPNPFNPWTTIRFTLSRPARVRLLIFDVSGARVRNLTDRALPAGEYHITWDGKNDRGRELASGAYFYRLEADREVQAKKLILLR